MQFYSQEQLENARRFIDKLRVDNGGISREDREFLERERPSILLSLESVRRKLGASTKILSEQLYQSSARFIYELIQNAEDNNYLITAEEPWLSFTLHHDRIVADSNEDGFSLPNIRAICSVGESTKSHVEGYIGEKGIGFKSVFKIAQKVHVQSGPYSFAFEYPRGDSGLGMVTPLNEVPQNLPPNVRTRMIMYLHSDNGPEHRDGDPENLFKQLLELPKTLLLFLKKLRRLTLHFELPGKDIRTIDYRITIGSGSARQITLRIDTGTPVTSKSSVERYRTAVRDVDDMPNDPARPGIRRAQIILAFPIDDNEAPIIEEQEVFAFLPLNHYGFKFLIQSDFITNANREGIVDTPWNQRLRDEVAETFRCAFRDVFSKHNDLRFTWVRYIPKAEVVDKFWGALRAKLLESLRSRYCLYSMAGSLEGPRQLRILDAQYRDAEGKPLLPDLVGENDKYISESYDKDIDLPILKLLGVKNLEPVEFISRLEKDLDHENRKDSRMMSTSSGDPWHTQVAKLLLGMAKTEELKTRIRKTSIIPLDNGNWVAPFNASIYIPSTGGVDIPKELPLNLVGWEPLENKSREMLFKELGVTECPPELVFSFIQLRYTGIGSFTTALVQEDLQFAFCHYTKRPDHYRIYVVSVDNFYGDISASSWALYCPISNHPYAAFRLFNGLVPTALSGKVKYLLPEFYDALGQCGTRNGHTGIEWLRSLGVKETPQLCNKTSGNLGTEMSAELKYIAEKLSGKLLGVLEANWAQYNKCDEWDEYLRVTQVPVLDSPDMMNLDTTYLPLPKLKATVSDLGLQESFGFLKEVDGIAEVDVAKWGFVERFGVGLQEDVLFWLKLLKHARRNINVDVLVVLKIYQRLQTYIDSYDTDKIKDSFNGLEDLVYLPDKGEWTRPIFCIWSGPEWFNSRHRLQAIKEYKNTYSLFVNTLQVSDATMFDYLRFLKEIKKDDLDSEKEANVTMAYEEIYKLNKQRGWPDFIRDEFKDKELIYYHKLRSWHSPLECIWAPDDIQLPEKISLASEYRGLRLFFQDVLEVKTPSLEMHIRALQKRALETPEKDSILQEMKSICVFEPSARLLREKLFNCRFLPVRQPAGEITWMASTDFFAIADRKEYQETFRGKIKMLDFTLEEIHSVKLILEGLQLQERYMTRTVKEETKVRDGLLDDLLTKDLRRKAYAICRYAVHFGCRGPHSAFFELESLEVFTSDSISKEVSILEGSRKVSVPIDTAYIHVARTGGQLKLYIPREQRRRQVCLVRQLPIALLNHFYVPDALKGVALGSIITATSLYAVDAILDADGIIEIPGISPPEQSDDDDLTASNFPPDPVDHISVVENSVITTSHSHSTIGEVEIIPEIEVSSLRISQHGAENSGQHFGGHVHHFGSSISAPAGTISSHPSSPPVERDLYSELLSAVIRQARSMDGIPHAGDVLISPIIAGSAINAELAVSSSKAGENLFRIGAAGELFVYEYMKEVLKLPGFGPHNWKSKIRNRVAVHENYHHMNEPTTGPETSDIIYVDNFGVLTEALRSKNFFRGSGLVSDSAVIIGDKPIYYIEVKTTPGEVDFPFFRSGGQFETMERMSFRYSEPVKDIYLFARVFKLGASGMGLKLYVDPARLKRDGILKFSVDKYTISPGR